MTVRQWPLAPVIVAGATGALALTSLTLALTTVTDAADLIGENRANQWLAGLTFGIVGALVLASQPGNRLGWVLGAGGVCASAGSACSEYAAIALDPTPLPLGGVAAWLAAVLWLPPFLATVAAVPLLYPDGRLPSYRWRWPARTALVAGVVAFVGFGTTQAAVDDAGFPQIRNPLDLAVPDDVQLVIVAAGFGVVLVVGVAAVIAIVLRMRQVDTRQRQQAAWFVAAVALAGPVSFIPVPQVVDFVLNVIAVACLTIGVVRHGLFDIELVLSRTVVYAALTAVALGVYLAAAALLGARSDAGLLPAVLAAVAAMLLAGASRRVQRVVDRLMYGERRDPMSALTTLGDRLSAAIDTDDVLPATVEGVRTALNLPYAEVRLAGEDSPAFTSGTQPDRVAYFPLSHAGEEVGLLVVGLRRGEQQLARSDGRLLEAFARQAGVAAHGVRATRELRRSRERVVASREEERHRIRRDLHDGLGPALAGISLGLEAADRVVTRDPAGGTHLLRELRGDVTDCVDEVRRIVADLRPPALDEGLVTALRHQADLLTTRSGGRLVYTVTNPTPANELPSALEVAAYRIATEAMTNTLRHAHATTCQVDLDYDTSHLHLHITDNGTAEPPRTPGTGLMSMRERAEELGGVCTVTFRPGRGTEVAAALPAGRSSLTR
ncbi:histidine kinase [Kribbella amoyensis]|uniref:histidine kinase n=1 Tax=Kribbella amoyensis TaxID=996641 RepID=A0A561B7V3_9ACTN|nr:sensor histidine kinase [Kribbella amoyensis]TWD74838.1 histidine kinase [Kribbella amoyensis]